MPRGVKKVNIVKKHELVVEPPLVQPNHDRFLTGDTIQHVANSKAYDRSSTVAGLKVGKVYPDYNSAYRTPEQMGNFVNSGPGETGDRKGLMAKHVTVNPQRRFDDSQLDRPFRDIRSDQETVNDSDGRVVRRRNKRTNVEQTQHGHEVVHHSKAATEKKYEQSDTN